MRQIERRIKRFIGLRPGATLMDIASYLGQDPHTTKRILYHMKEKGLIIGKTQDQEQ